MGQHLRQIFCTYQLFRESVQWSQMPPLRERCNTELVTNTYFGSRLSLLVARSFRIGSSLILVISHLVCPLTALVLSSTVPKLHGRSSYSTTISLPKSDF